LSTGRPSFCQVRIIATAIIPPCVELTKDLPTLSASVDLPEARV
jgi:hypothetical protein